MMEVNVESGYGALRHTKGWAPTAWGIRATTHSYWNHIGFIWVDAEGNVWVIEADPPVVKMTPIAEFINPKKYDIKIIALREDAFKDKAEHEMAIVTATAFMLDNIGKKYDRGAIIWLALCYTILPILRKLKSNGFQNRLEFFCSEIVCQAWHGTSTIIQNLFAGLKHPEATCDTITPGDISKAVSVRYLAGKDIE